MKKAFKIIFYVLCAICVIFSLAIGGWLSWVVAIIGLLFAGVATLFERSEAVGETDKTILALLIYASLQDGMSAQEQQYIQEYIKRRGLSQKQVKAVEKYAEDPSKWKFSTEEKQKMRILDEVAGLIKSDGEISESEKKFMEIVAQAISVDKDKALAKLQ